MCVDFYVLDETPLPDPWPALEEECRQRLQKAGVPTRGEEGCDESKGQVSVFLYVAGVPSASGRLWAYVVSLELSQRVTLQRDASQVVEGVTFNRLAPGLAETDRVVTAVREESLRLMDAFGEFYRTESKRPIPIEP